MSVGEYMICGARGLRGVIRPIRVMQPRCRGNCHAATSVPSQ